MKYMNKFDINSQQKTLLNNNFLINQTYFNAQKIIIRLYFILYNQV